MSVFRAVILAVIGVLVSNQSAVGQSYELIEVTSIKSEKAELSWLADVKKDEPWRIRYRSGNQDVNLSGRHASWNSKSKKVEIELSIGPVNEGNLRLDLVDMQTKTLIGQIGASTAFGTGGLKTIKVNPRRDHSESDPETFTMGIVFDDHRGCRQTIALYKFKLPTLN